ncbi:MAG: hypothetical protein HYT16_00625 [DPANN group archaeon]|nr:hypothetical protein [DPANN group archaeon]
MVRSTLRKGLLIGVGAAAMANDLAKKTLRHLAKKHRITAKDGKKVVRESLALVRELQQGVYKTAGKQVSRQLRKALSQARAGLKKVDSVLAGMERKAKR